MSNSLMTPSLNTGPLVLNCGTPGLGRPGRKDVDRILQGPGRHSNCDPQPIRTLVISTGYSEAVSVNTAPACSPATKSSGVKETPQDKPCSHSERPLGGENSVRDRNPGHAHVEPQKEWRPLRNPQGRAQGGSAGTLGMPRQSFSVALVRLDHSTGLTFSARGPLGPSPISNETFCPSWRSS